MPATSWWRLTWWPIGHMVQGLALPAATLQRRGGGLAAFGEILRTLVNRSYPNPPQRVLMKISLWAEIRRLHEIGG